MSNLPLHKMKSPLDDVLVVCNFIHPFYSNIPIIRSLYQFQNIVFYGDELYDAPEDVIRYDQSSGLAKKNASCGGGMFAYRALLDARKRFPGYRGYLFLMDDCFIRPHLLEALSRSKIWHSKTSAGVPLDEIPNDFDHKPIWKNLGPGKDNPAFGIDDPINEMDYPQWDRILSVEPE